MDDKLKKTVDDEQLDEVAGGCVMPQDENYFKEVNNILKNITRTGEPESVPNFEEENPFEEKKPVTKLY